MFTKNKPLVPVVCTLAMLVVATGAQAQVAKITAVEKIVEKCAGGACEAGGAGWNGAAVNSTLKPGDWVRTLKRSRAEVRFLSDGSMVRLGQLSSLLISSATAGSHQMRLKDGVVIYAKNPKVAGTSTIVTGTGAAEIKGSVAIVKINDDGSSDYSNYNGDVSVVGYDAGGKVTSRVALPPGRWVRSYAGGVLGEIAIAPPLIGRGDVAPAPAAGPFAGSREQVLDRILPAQVGIDTNLVTSSSGTLNHDQANPFIHRALVGPTPPPDFPPGGASIGRPRGATGSSRGLLPVPSSYSASGAGQSLAAAAVGTLLAQAPPAPNKGDNAANVANQAARNGAAVTGSDVDLGPADEHLKEVDDTSGKISGIDYRAIGLVGSDGLRGAFGRLHLFQTDGAWSGDLVLAPQAFRFDNPVPVKVNRIVVPQAQLTYQSEYGAIIGGRQRYLAGPMRASFYGSMLRSGGREIMDGLRFVPKLGKHYSAEISYLHDAFPRFLPYNIAGSQKGVFGRVSMHQSYGNFGLNVLSYSKSPVPDRTGVSIDFALPLLRNKVEGYGEIGTDPFKRSLRSFGLTFPGIYQKTGYDIYLEHARLGNSASSVGMPGELGLRVYRTMSKTVDVVLAVNDFKGGGTQVVLGVSVGGRKTVNQK